MSYTKTNWTDRVVQYPNRYTDELANVKTFTANPGTITEAGTTITASRMNNIETGVETAFNKSRLHDRELANLEAVLDIDNQAIANNGKFYDLFDATNNYSAGVLDTTRTQLNGAHSAGGKVLTVDSTTGFVAGQEITLQDDTNIEDGVIDSVDSGTQLTLVANLANNYKADADVYRSNVLVSGSKMNFGSWTSGATYTHTTPIQVINAAYSTSGSGGRKVVVLSNGWIVAVVCNTSTNYFNIYKSTDNGATFTFVKNITNVTGSGYWAVASYGNVLYTLMADGSGTGIYFRSTDMVTEVQSSVITVDTQSSIGVGCSLAVDATGNLYAAWSSKNASYSTNFNVRYSKSTNAGATWAAPTQITTLNSGSTYAQYPCVIACADNTPRILLSFYNGVTYIIRCYKSDTTYVDVYSAGAYEQINSSAVVDATGAIHVAWQGNADGEAMSIRYSTSADVGATWTTQVQASYTAGTASENPSIAVDAVNKPHIVFRTTATGAYNIYKTDKTSGNWSAKSALTTNNSSNADNPSVCSNYTSFTDPICIYKDPQATKVQFRGIFSATTITSLLINKARYNIIPPMGTTTEIASWVQKERESTETDFVVTAFESIVDTSADESYTAMTKSSTYIAANLAEDQFLMSAVTAQEKVTLKLVLTRATTSIAKAITKVLGAIN